MLDNNVIDVVDVESMHCMSGINAQRNTTKAKAKAVHGVGRHFAGNSVGMTWK